MVLFSYKTRIYLHNETFHSISCTIIVFMFMQQ